MSSRTRLLIETARRRSSAPIVRLALPPVVPGREAVDELRETGAGVGVERVEQLVDVDDRRRVVGVDRGAVVQLAAEVRARADVDVAAGDADEAAARIIAVVPWCSGA